MHADTNEAGQGRTTRFLLAALQYIRPSLMIVDCRSRTAGMTNSCARHSQARSAKRRNEEARSPHLRDLVDGGSAKAANGLAFPVGPCGPVPGRSAMELSPVQLGLERRACCCDERGSRQSGRQKFAVHRKHSTTQDGHRRDLLRGLLLSLEYDPGPSHRHEILRTEISCSVQIRFL